MVEPVSLASKLTPLAGCSQHHVMRCLVFYSNLLCPSFRRPHIRFQQASPVAQTIVWNEKHDEYSSKHTGVEYLTLDRSGILSSIVCAVKG